MKFEKEIKINRIASIKRKYLSGVIRPFRDKVKYIIKRPDLTDKEFIKIEFEEERTI